MPDKKELSEEIQRFLSEHAKISARYDPEFHRPEERFSSPDASTLEYAAKVLERGEVPDRRQVHSEWGSGGYKGDGKEWHDSIMEKIRELQ